MDDLDLLNTPKLKVSCREFRLGPFDVTSLDIDDDAIHTTFDPLGVITQADLLDQGALLGGEVGAFDIQATGQSNGITISQWRPIAVDGCGDIGD